MIACNLVIGNMERSSEINFCTVRTNNGVVKGKLVEVPLKYPGEEEYAHNVPVESYLGIPYAQQPVGVRRFKQLEPVEPWEGDWDATEFRNSPIQVKSNLSISFNILYCRYRYIPNKPETTRVGAASGTQNINFTFCF